MVGIVNQMPPQMVENPPNLGAGVSCKRPTHSLFSHPRVILRLKWHLPPLVRKSHAHGLR
jgi:hypothetical protein